jgi:hypothetical protein
MIAVLMPTYFDHEKTYCTREYMAMERLEKRRLQQLGAMGAADEGLIIPVVVRGFSDVPGIVRNKRQCHDLTGYSLIDPDLSSNSQYAQRIRGIAEYIHQQCKRLAGLPQDLENCDEFTVPSEKVSRAWLKKNGIVNYSPSFPGRP